MGGSGEDFFQGLGCLIAIVATVMAVASIPFLGPIPIGIVLAVGYSLYRSKGRC